MNKQKVLIVGNCILDRIYTLPYYPEQDEELRALQISSVLGGNACNTAQILAQLEVDVDLMSTVADDAEAKELIQQLQDKNVSTALCQQYPGHSTPHSSIWLNQQNGSRTIVHYRNLPELSLADLQQIKSHEYQWIHFEGRNIQTLSKFLPILSKQGVALSLEIEKQRPQIEQLLPFVGTVIISKDYVEKSHKSADQVLHNFKQVNPALNVVCTLGESGLKAIDKTGKHIIIEAEPVTRVIDTIGAGDSFIAGVISQLIQQTDFATALKYANQLAANKIQHKGMVINV